MGYLFRFRTDCQKAEGTLMPVIEDAEVVVPHMPVNWKVNEARYVPDEVVVPLVLRPHAIDAQILAQQLHAAKIAIQSRGEFICRQLVLMVGTVSLTYARVWAPHITRAGCLHDIRHVS